MLVLGNFQLVPFFVPGHHSSQFEVLIVSYNNGDLLYRKEDNIREFHWKHGRDAGDIRVLGAEGFDINGRGGEDGLREPGIRKNGEERCEI